MVKYSKVSWRKDIVKDCDSCRELLKDHPLSELALVRFSDDNKLHILPKNRISKPDNVVIYNLK